MSRHELGGGGPDAHLRSADAWPGARASAGQPPAAPAEEPPSPDTLDTLDATEHARPAPGAWSDQARSPSDATPRGSEAHSGRPSTSGSGHGGRLARGAVIQVAGRVTKIVAGVLAFAFASRALSVSVFGDFVVAFAYITLFNTVATFGLDRILIRDFALPESGPGGYDRLARVSVTTKLLLSVAATALCIGLAPFLNFHGHLFTLIVFFSPYITITAFGSSGLYGSILQARHRPTVIALVHFVAATTIVGFTVAVAVLRPTVYFFLLAYILSGLCDVGICYLNVRRMVQLKPGWAFSLIRYLAIQSFPLGIASGFVLIYGRIDTILLNELTTPAQVALYGVAYKYYDVLSTVGGTAMLVLFPALVRAHSVARAATRDLYTRLFTLMLALALPAAFLVVLFRALLVRLVVGSEYLAATTAMPGLMLAVAISFPSMVASYMLIVVRKQNLNLPLAICATAVNIGLNLWLIPSMGFVAAAWVTAATEGFVILYNVTAVVIVARFIPDPRPFVLVLLAAAPMALAFVPGISPYVGGSVGIVVYAILLVALGIVRPAQLRELVSRQPAAVPVGAAGALTDLAAPHSAPGTQRVSAQGPSARAAYTAPTEGGHISDAVGAWDEPSFPQRPLRIAMDAQCLQTARTGVRTYVTELLAQFERSDMPHRVVPLSGPRGLPRTRRIFRIINQMRYMTWLHIGLPWSLRRKDYDVLFSPEYLTPVWCPIPRVVTYHDSAFLRRPQDYNRLWRLMFRRLALPAMRRVGAVIVPSHYTRSEAITRGALPAERVHVTPLGGPEPGSMRVSEAEAAPTLDRIGVTPHRYLLHVGVLERRKNLVTLVRAFDAWQKQGGIGTGYKLVLVGQPGPRPDLNDAPHIRAEIDRRGLREAVVLAGHLSSDQVKALYSYAAAVVIPSRSEGFGLTVLETFAAGVPLICSAAGALPEVAGNAALLFDPEQPEQVVECLNRLCGDPALQAALVRAGSARARLFTWEATAWGTMQVFQAAAGARTRGARAARRGALAKQARARR